MIIFNYVYCSVGLEDFFMDVSNKKLWILLINRDMKKKDLRSAAKLSTSTMSKLNKGLNIQTDVLVRICRVLNCDISEISFFAGFSVHCHG